MAGPGTVLEATFDNSGTIKVQSGTLAIVQGTSVGGTFLVADASLTVDNNSATFLGGLLASMRTRPSAGRAT